MTAEAALGGGPQRVLPCCLRLPQVPSVPGSADLNKKRPFVLNGNAIFQNVMGTYCFLMKARRKGEFKGRLFQTTFIKMLYCCFSWTFLDVQDNSKS